MTPLEAKRHRKHLTREIEKELRAKDKIVLGEIRARIHQARAARREHIAEARHNCKAAKRALKERQKAERERLKFEQQADRIARRGSCDSSKQQASVEGGRAVTTLRGELRGTAAELRNIARAGKATRVRSTSRERRSENDDSVRRDIPQDLVPVFEKVKHRIKGSERRSRAEAFLEWAHENPEEVVSVQQADADHYLKELIAKEKEQGRIMRKAGRYKLSKVEVLKRLADVPF
jgi:hypothetical protein